MSAPPVVQRFSPVVQPGGWVHMQPCEDGESVRFADVEAALHDRDRFEWLQPIIEGDDDAVANRRTMALALGLQVGKTGRELVDFARARCPS